MSRVAAVSAAALSAKLLARLLNLKPGPGCVTYRPLRSSCTGAEQSTGAC
jgi:hypothetical protein